ncbi:MAG: primosomal protein N' [Candidatus Enteromonas sp.]|nr:primosomal protein N' [Candidatus Enteromonas sp.]
MWILEVLTQYRSYSLDRPFSYLYDGESQIQPFCRVLVPFANRSIVGFVTRVELTDQTPEEIAQRLGFRLGFIQGVIDEHPLFHEELWDLAQEVASYCLSPLIHVLNAMLPPSLKPSKGGLKGPKIAYEDYLTVVDPSLDELTPKQREILLLIQRNEEIKKKEAGSPSIVKKLLELGKIRLVKKEKVRFEIPEYQKEQPHPLTLEQEKAMEEILQSPQDVVLLQGVTGSGKTEVYLHLSERYLQNGKNILMLVPEISLTPVMVEYFSRRFGKAIAILHSGLTPAEKYDEYRRIASGAARIVVGARSAVFAPLRNIGLIILDEEHVESYKQDSPPFYHARTVAILRAKHFGAKVVLGSATPSLETKARAQKRVYGYAVLPHRVNSLPLPKTEIIDLRDRSIMVAGDRIFSKILLDAIRDRLAKGEQVMLLVNRRGYSSYLSCARCGHTVVCPSCGGNLTYHKEDELLKCHHCGHVELYPEVCPECGSGKLQRVGFGTERAVKLLLEYLPEARIARLDTDVSKVRASMERTLRDFKEGKYDILIGTQMIAKGHDFPKVTLVGVVVADAGLMLESYRASERTFGLIAQALGRSGRGDIPGCALIQTSNPNHYAITLGAKQDYESFYRREMQERRLGKYPPYTYMVSLIFLSKDETKATEAALSFQQAILQKKLPDVDSLGPLTPYYGKMGEYFRKTLLIRFKNPEPIKSEIRELLHVISGKGGVDILADVDPFDY